MAVDVIIKDCRLVRPRLRLQDLVLPGMRYGRMTEGGLLVENEVSEYTQLFQTEEICRGFDLKQERGQVSLRQTLPTSERDIRFFFAYVQRLCGLLHAKTCLVDGEKMTAPQREQYIDEVIAASRKAL